MGRTISGLILIAATVSSLGAMQAPRSVLEKLRDIRSVPPDLVIPPLSEGATRAWRGRLLHR